MIGTQRHHRAWLIALLAVLALLVAGCATEAAPTEEPDEVEAITTTPGIVSATGVVVPAHEATLSFTIDGQVIELLVEEGDTVQAGDVIARLDPTLLDAEITKAEAALAVAEANLAAVQAGAHPEEIAEVQANLAVAGANTAVSAATRDDVLTPDVEQSEILNAQVLVEQATIDSWARWTEAEWTGGTTVRPDEYENYELRSLPPLAADAYKRYEDSVRELAVTQAQLAELQRGPNENDVRAAEAEVWATGAEYNSAQADLDLAQAGPRETEVAVAEAAVESARVALESARLDRAEAEITAPFAGTISRVYIQPAQYVGPGEAVVLVADLSSLRVETTDLNEIDVANIALGDAATITFDALPGISVDGTVSYISPRAEEGTGVNFTVRLDVEEMPPAVRWGMTAFVDIPVN